ncbi:MAG: PEP-CTERM sorting domain-containing protein [Planctomycetota bacterium]|nr:PEP-CTERM sorting domain-containing protein [Planctomycetota bacterium]
MTKSLFTGILGAGALALAAGSAFGSLSAGSIAFTGFNADNEDNLAFVALEGLAAGTEIFFTDNEWNGSALNTGEAVWKWTASGAIAAGTIITIDRVNGPALTDTVSNLGAVTWIDSTNRGVANSNETVYAFTGSVASPTFLAAIANSGFSAANGLLTGSGLVAGSTALDLTGGKDVGRYAGARSGQLAFSGYLPLINNLANWITADGTGDQSGAFLPFDPTSFTIIPTPGTLVLAGAGMLIAGRRRRA